MELSTWFDLGLCFVLFGLFVYVFATVKITSVHKAYFAFHFLMLLWPLCQFGIQTSADPALQLFYLDIAFVDCSLIGAGWLVFTLFLIGRSKLLRTNSMMLIFAPALLAALGVVLNPNGIFVLPLHGGYIKRAYGPLFWCIIAILLAYLIYSVYLMLQTLASAPSPRVRNQIHLVVKGILLLIVCTLADIVLNVVLAPWLPVIPGLTSSGLLLSDIFFVIAIRRDKILDLLIIAHQHVIDSIASGILVLDENETVVEINRAMSAHLALQSGEHFEIDVFLARCTVGDNRNAFLEAYRERPLEKANIDITLEAIDPRYGILHVAPILVDGIRAGRMVLFQDVSELRRLVDEKKRQNLVLQERNEALLAIQEQLHQANRKLERQAITDNLTGCYNRHYLTQRLEHEVMEHVRSSTPFALILLDIDHFKQVNDRYGHLTGDEVILCTADTIRRLLRPTDIFARYGGEEFLIYLPLTTRSEGAALAEQLKTAVESNQVKVVGEAWPLSITISLGLLSIETYPEESLRNTNNYLTELLQMADEALYQAKEEGRNRVVMRGASSSQAMPGILPIDPAL